MTLLRITRAECLQALEEEFGRPILEIGVPTKTIQAGITQPTFHIDLNMAMVRDRHRGKEVVVLQSPRVLLEEVLGLSDVTAMSESEFYQSLATAAQRLDIGVKTDEDRHVNKPEDDLLKMLGRLNYTTYKWRIRQSEYLRRLLVEHGYEVKMVAGLVESAGSMDRAAFPMLSVFNYTNAIFSGSIALIPEMGIKALDQHARKIYESLGYQVFGMASSAQSFCLSGGIRCLTETYRHDAPQP